MRDLLVDVVFTKAFLEFLSTTKAGMIKEGVPIGTGCVWTLFSLLLFTSSLFFTLFFTLLFYFPSPLLSAFLSSQ